jgi:hypothetical protein
MALGPNTLGELRWCEWRGVLMCVQHCEVSLSANYWLESASRAVAALNHYSALSISIGCIKAHGSQRAPAPANAAFPMAAIPSRRGSAVSLSPKYRPPWATAVPALAADAADRPAGVLRSLPRCRQGEQCSRRRFRTRISTAPWSIEQHRRLESSSFRPVSGLH